ncbi:hypothetical protein GNP79_13255 [Aliivibrio fischeri]|uniref:Type I restriction modification DNA specificity domain-containing protein n=1 Tax=Aliivibrio fischeri TaxID=668 RepID=A0A6N3Z3T8_ALIFS|nr:restriction endonuclease subunit S [Aliivibrio fischeri]MUK46927.1 hypothetical protein [Aliivibrio fischeri]MUK81762.1 hypothetical protein [Aliivibrio fischeri]MUK84847.1 hypothetical protein [Aliivibrio fischeri]
MTEQMNVPKLRFGEFDKVWALNKAKINIVAGNAYKLDEYTDNGYLLIQGLHIQPDKIVLEDKPKYVKQSDGNHVKIDKGDIVLGLNRPITNNQLKASRFKLDAESVLYQRAGKLSFDISKLDSEFLYQYLKCSTFMKQLDLELIGSDQPYIRSNLFQATKNVFPLLPEQQKIASFLSKIDEKIGLLSEKKDKLTEYKRGVMQQLFNGKWHEQDGQPIFVPPTLRFKADDGSEFPDWEEKTLGDVNSITGGGTPSTTDESLWGGNIQWFTPTELKTKYVSVSKRTITDKGLSNSSAKILPKGTVLFSSRATVGDVSITQQECTTNQGFQSFNGKPKKANNEFTYYWISSHKNEFLRRASGSTFLEISKSEIAKVSICLPSLDEQIKIANFLSAIDQKIDLANFELNKAKEWKRGLLQQMFV